LKEHRCPKPDSPSPKILSSADLFSKISDCVKRLKGGIGYNNLCVLSSKV
jgi:hypothetical protein